MQDRTLEHRDHHSAHNPAAELSYQDSLLQLSNVTQTILLKLKPQSIESSNSQRKLTQITYPDDAQYKEIQRILENITNYYQEQKTLLNRKKHVPLTQTIALLDQYVHVPIDSFLRVNPNNKNSNAAFFGRLIQITVAMSLVSLELYQFAFVSQAAWLATNIFLINASILGLIGIAIYIYLVHVSKEPTVNALLTQLSEKLTPYQEILCKIPSAVPSKECSSLSSQSAAGGQVAWVRRKGRAGLPDRMTQSEIVRPKRNFKQPTNAKSRDNHRNSFFASQKRDEQRDATPLFYQSDQDICEFHRDSFDNLIDRANQLLIHEPIDHQAVNCDTVIKDSRHWARFSYNFRFDYSSNESPEELYRSTKRRPRRSEMDQSVDRSSSIVKKVIYSAPDARSQDGSTNRYSSNRSSSKSEKSDDQSIKSLRNFSSSEESDYVIIECDEAGVLRV